MDIKQIIYRVLLFIPAFMLISCAGYEVGQYKCHIPSKPVYKPLDRNKHIADKKNMELLMMMITDMSAYNARLENAVRCFDGEE